MRIEITAHFDTDDDGFNGSVSTMREDVDDLYTFAQYLTDFTRGIGYDYVVNVGFEKDDGSVLFGMM